MYQMFVGGQNMSRIQAGLAKLFGIQIDIPSIYGFKRSIALNYRDSYSGILERLKTSPVLYVDETIANLQSETGYVWCITDGRSAFYFYKSSREGSFLPNMFEGFKGVLALQLGSAFDVGLSGCGLVGAPPQRP